MLVRTPLSIPGVRRQSSAVAGHGPLPSCWSLIPASQSLRSRVGRQLRRLSPPAPALKRSSLRGIVDIVVDSSKSRGIRSRAEAVTLLRRISWLATACPIPALFGCREVVDTVDTPEVLDTCCSAPLEGGGSSDERLPPHGPYWSLLSDHSGHHMANKGALWWGEVSAS